MTKLANLATEGELHVENMEPAGTKRARKQEFKKQEREKQEREKQEQEQLKIFIKEEEKKRKEQSKPQFKDVEPPSPWEELNEDQLWRILWHDGPKRSLDTGTRFGYLFDRANNIFFNNNNNSDIEIPKLKPLSDDIVNVKNILKKFYNNWDNIKSEQQKNLCFKLMLEHVMFQVPSGLCSIWEDMESNLTKHATKLSNDYNLLVKEKELDPIHDEEKNNIKNNKSALTMIDIFRVLKELLISFEYIISLGETFKKFPYNYTSIEEDSMNYFTTKVTKTESIPNDQPGVTLLKKVYNTSDKNDKEIFDLINYVVDKKPGTLGTGELAIPPPRSFNNG